MQLSLGEKTTTNFGRKAGNVKMLYDNHGITHTNNDRQLILPINKNNTISVIDSKITKHTKCRYYRTMSHSNIWK